MKIYTDLTYKKVVFVKGKLAHSGQGPFNPDFIWETQKPKNFINDCLSHWSDLNNIAIWKKHGYDRMEEFLDLYEKAPPAELPGMEKVMRQVLRELQDLAGTCIQYLYKDNDGYTPRCYVLGYSTPEESVTS